MTGPVVCVVGAGTAGLEGLLSARAALGVEAQLRLIAPDREFRYRPMDARALFRPAQERGVAIAELAAQARAEPSCQRRPVNRPFRPEPAPGLHSLAGRTG